MLGRIWSWLMGRNWRTHVGHLLQALIGIQAVMLLTDGMVKLNDWPMDPGFYTGSLVMLGIFTHKEVAEIIPPILGVLYPGKRYADRAAAQAHLTAKLEDGFGDWWVVPLAIAFFAALGVR